MPLCVQCGFSTLGTAEICSHHESGHGDDWATANRLMCDFLHRGVVAPTPCKRDEDLELLVSPY
jgi:hypothetical protein